MPRFNYPRLCARYSTGGLPAVCASRRPTHPTHLGDAIVNPSRLAPLEHPLAPWFEHGRLSRSRAVSQLDSSLPWHRPQLSN